MSRSCEAAVSSMRAHRLRLSLVLAALLIAFSAQPLQRAANGSSQAVRVVDRTFGCPVGIRAGLRKIEVEAQAGIRSTDDRSKWQSRPTSLAVDPTMRRARLVGTLASWSQIWQPGQVPTTRALWISTTCTVLRTPVPLSRIGLLGGAASPFGDVYECVVPKNVVIRVRATFRSATSLTAAPEYGEANGVIREGSVSIRLPSGRPVAFLTAKESGAAALFVSQSCVAD